MKNYNKVTLIGRVVQDPEIKTLPNDNQVVNFAVAVNRQFKGKDGQLQEETDFIDCEIFGDKAGYFNQTVKKGGRVFLEGELRQQKWQTPEGDKRSKVAVKVWDFLSMDYHAPDRSGETTGGGEAESVVPPDVEKAEKPARTKAEKVNPKTQQKKELIPF